MADSLPDVSAELVDRVADGAGIESDALTPTPTNETTPTQATPEGAVQPEGTTPVEDSFTPIDPSTLPEELRPIYRSLQGDYTRKQQEAAPWRKLGEELGIDSPDALREAAELHAYLQDPNNLADFSRQLNEALGTGQPTPAATPPADDLGTFDDLEDTPGLAALKAEIEQLRSQVQTDAQARQAEQLQWALVGEINRQNALLTEQHPEYRDEDWNAIYEIAPAFDGDLIQTANALEAFASHRLASYLGQKTGVADNPAHTPVPAPYDAATPREINADNDPELRNAGAEAMEYVRNVLGGDLS